MQTCPNCGVVALHSPKSPDISPISSLVATNNPPEPQDEAIACQLIASSEAGIAQIDGLITQVQQMLADLISRRAEYEHHLHQHKNVIRNIRCIPAEILVEIFLQTVIDGDPNDIWAVVEVCRRWREVALAAPTLWSIFPFNPSVRPITILSRLSRSLQLSRSAPLILRISCDPSYPICPFQVLVSPHSKRLTHLAVHDLSKPSQSKFFGSSNSILTRSLQWDSLRSLELQFTGGSYTEAIPVTIFQHAPLLQDVDLNFAYRQNIAYIMSNILLPWSQLRKLSIGDISLESVFTILQEASILEECHISSSDTSTPSNIPTLSHQYLTMLHVTAWTREVAHGLFNHLTLPSLRQLSVDGLILEIDTICTLIERSSCRLTFLNLPTADPLVANDILRHLFSLLPDVTELCIHISFASFERIGARLAPTLLPQLRHLCLEGTDSHKRCDLVTLLHIAYMNVPPLETVILTAYGRHLYELIPRLPTSKDPQIQMLQQWNRQLEELSSSFDADDVGDNSVFYHDLGHILSLMSSESETGMPGKYLCHETGQTVFSKLQGLLEQAPDDIHLRISAILALSLPRIQRNRTYGWMENVLARTAVYTRRHGSLQVKVRAREKDRFASFALKNGHLTLPLGPSV